MTPGTAANSSRARSGVIASRVSTWTASEWLTKTGMRTAVHEIRRSGQVEDLAVLGDDLPFLLRVAVGQEDVDLGQRVEGDRVRVDGGDRGLTGDVGPDLALELGDGVGAGPRHGLVGIDDDPFEADACRAGPSGPGRAASSSSSGWR